MSVIYTYPTIIGTMTLLPSVLVTDLKVQPNAMNWSYINGETMQKHYLYGAVAACIGEASSALFRLRMRIRWLYRDSGEARLHGLSFFRLGSVGPQK